MNFAVVIGIEAYANTDWNLSAAVSDALEFAKWALGPGEVPEKNLRLLLSPSPDKPLDISLEYKVADCVTITTVIQELQDGGGKGCQRLYFYYAGHGVSAPGVKRGDGPVEPVLIPNDVRNLKQYSHLLIGFSGIIPLLWNVEPLEQFYFIDACRDFALEDSRPPIGAVGPWRPTSSDTAVQSAQYGLYATSPGQRAHEEKKLGGRGIFAKPLMDALWGRAQGAMAPNSLQRCYEVRFSTLFKYVEKQIKSELQRIAPGEWERYLQVPAPFASAGSPDPTLAVIKPEDTGKLSVRVRVGPSAARPTCRVQMLQWVPGLNKDVEVDAQGPPAAPEGATFSLYPGDYALQASADQYLPVRQVCEVFEPRTLDFKLEAGAPLSAKVYEKAPDFSFLGFPGGLEFPVPRGSTGGRELPGQEISFPSPAEESLGLLSTRLKIVSSDQEAKIRLLNPDRQIVAAGTGEVSYDKPGIYRAQLVLPEGPAQEQLVEIRDGTRLTLHLTAPPPPLGQAQMRKLAELGLDVDKQGYLHPSAYLGGVAGLSLASLLGFAAFGVIFPSHYGFEKLKALGVLPPTDLVPADSGLLVLLGASGNRPAPGLDVPAFLSQARLAVRRAGGELMGETGFTVLSGFPAASQYSTGLPPGLVVARLDLPEAASTQYALVCLQNRVTVLVVVANDTGGYEIQQYLVPVSHEGPATDFLSGPDNIRRLELAQRYYVSGQTVLSENDLFILLNGKWLDPLLGALAGYSLVRAGRCREYIGRPDPSVTRPQPSAMYNMLNFFGDLPDSHVLAGLCDPENRARHYANALTRGLPVFAAGVEALAQWHREEGKEMPLLLAETSRFLLSGSTWTAWASLRPALIIQGGRFASPPHGWEVLEQYREAVEPATRAVGCIELSGHPSLEWLGTGFLVAEDIIMTAGFVAEAFSEQDSGVWRFKTGVGARIDFLREVDNQNAAEFPLVDILLIDSSISLALFRIARQSAQGAQLPNPLNLAGEPPVPLLGRQIYVVGYPARDIRVHPDMLEAFAGIFEIKRLQPGMIVGELPDQQQFEHDCLTLGGNAGSPVIDLETGQVLGLHLGGRAQEHKQKRNFALALWKLRNYPLLQEAGIRFT